MQNLEDWILENFWYYPIYTTVRRNKVPGEVQSLLQISKFKYHYNARTDAFCWFSHN